MKKGNKQFYARARKERTKDFRIEMGGETYDVTLIKPPFSMVKKYAEMSGPEGLRDRPHEVLDSFGELVAHCLALPVDEALDVLSGAGGTKGPLMEAILDVAGLNATQLEVEGDPETPLGQ